MSTPKHTLFKTGGLTHQQLALLFGKTRSCLKSHLFYSTPTWKVKYCWEKKKLSCIIVTKTNKINSLVIIIYLVSITTPVKNLHKLSVYKYCTIFLNQPLIMFHCIMNICYTILLRHLHTYLVLCYKRDYLRYKRDYLCYKIDHLFKSFTQNQNFNMVNT